jgi:hypothetical protein
MVQPTIGYPDLGAVAIVALPGFGIAAHQQRLHGARRSALSGA